LNGETNTGTTYIADASTNNFALTVAGAATPNRFSPLWGAGYYGNYFDGSTGYLSYTQSTALGTNNFTIECWVNIPSSPSVNYWLWGYRNADTSPYFYISSTNIPRFTGDTTNFLVSAVAMNLNTWNHIAVVRNGLGTNNLQMYLNGVSVASSSTTQSFTFTGSQSIGKSLISTAYYMNGYISNFRIVNGTAVYTANFTPPTTPLTAIANTALLTCQSTNIVDNSTNNFALTPIGTITVVPNQPFGALPSGVQSYGSSLFDGSTGYLSAPSSAGALGTNPFTIEFWYYGIANGNAYATVVSKNVTGSPSSGTWGFGINFNGTPAVWFSYYTTGFVDVQTSQAVSNQQWHHIAATRNGTTLNLYLDGVLTQTATLPSNFSFGPTSDPTLIGYNSRNTAYINGYVSNFRIVNGTAVYTSAFTPPTTPLTAITNTALLTLQNKNGINNNIFYDDSTNNFALTRTGTPTQGTFTPYSQTGWSNYFSASTNDALVFPSISAYAIGTGSFTMEAWFNSPLTAAPGNNYFLFIQGQSGTTDLAIQFNTSSILFTIETSTVITYSGGWTAGSWNHVALVRNGTACAMYFNGVSVGTATNSTSINQRQVLVGGINWAGGTLTASVSNVRYSNIARYTSAFTPSTTAFTSDVNTILLTCQNNRFLDNSTNAAVPTFNGTPQVQAFSPFAPGVAYSPTNNGGSMYFNGSTDYIVTPSISVGTNNFTIECWIYYTGSTWVSGGIFVSEVSGGIQFNVYSQGLGIATQGVAYILTTSSGLNYGAWNHVVCVRGGTGTNQTSFYINGTRTLNGTLASNFSAGAYTVGGFYNTGNGAYFPGYISNFRFTNGADLYGYGNTTIPIPTAPPTPTANATLLLLGTNTGVQDATGKNDLITVGSIKTQSNTAKYGTGAMYFDGSTGYLQNLSAINKQLFAFGSGNFTVELWVYPLSQGGHGSGNNDCLIDFRNNISGGAGVCGVLYIYNNGTSVNWFVNGAIAISGSSISNNTWNHIAVSRSGTSTKLFINGTQAGSTFSDSTVYVASPITIGQFYDGSGGGYFNGYIDDLRITNGVARYTANFTPPASAFLTL
jgi:hypothetical protein